MSYKYDSISTLDQSSSFLATPEITSSQDLTDYVFQMAQKNKNTAKFGSINKPAEFLLLSQQISQEIRKTTTTLHKLNELYEAVTSRTTRFHTEDAKIHDLTFSVKESISDIQNKMTRLQKNNDLISSRQAEKLSSNIIDTLALRFADLTKNFKRTLENRAKTIQQFQEKESSSSLSLLGSSGHGIRKRNIKKTEAFVKKGRAFDPEENASGYNDEASGSGLGAMREHANVENLRKQREEAKEIQKMLEETMGLFQRVSTMVRMHEVMIERIDKDTEDALKHVEGGRRNLVKYIKDMSSMRRMIISVFIFLMIFATVYILII